MSDRYVVSKALRDLDEVEKKLKPPKFGRKKPAAGDGAVAGGKDNPFSDAAMDSARMAPSPKMHGLFARKGVVRSPKTTNPQYRLSRREKRQISRAQVEQNSLNNPSANPFANL